MPSCIWSWSGLYMRLVPPLLSPSLQFLPFSYVFVGFLQPFLQYRRKPQVGLKDLSPSLSLSFSKYLLAKDWKFITLSLWVTLSLSPTTAIESLKFPPAALAFTAKPNHHFYTQTLQASQYPIPPSTHLPSRYCSIWTYR